MSHQALVPGPPSESPTRLGCQESPSPADPGATGPGNRHSNSSPSQAGRGGQGPASLSSGARPRSRFALPAGGPRPSAPEVMRLSWPACILLPRCSGHLGPVTRAFAIRRFGSNFGCYGDVVAISKREHILLVLPTNQKNIRSSADIQSFINFRSRSQCPLTPLWLQAHDENTASPS